MSFTKLDVPVSVQSVNKFVSLNAKLFEETLRDIRKMIEWAVRAERIVKIYGREDRQGGDKFKNVRKIAGKFNSYHNEKSNSHGSLWEIPDIIGFTVVVSYPSDIVAICRILDKLIGQGSMRADKVRGAHVDDREKAQIDIDPEYGRVLSDRGYFACHYNVRQHSYNEATSPICEIQIKTAMHDAWGAKTHDLIYKSPAPFDPNLLKNFEALGDVLAQIDWQSDLLRDTLSNVSRVRKSKKNAINECVMSDMFEEAMSSIQKKFSKTKDGIDFKESLSKVSLDTSYEEVRKVETQIMSLSNRSAVNYSFENFAPFIAHYFLARNANDRVALRKAEQGLALWMEKIEDPFEQTFAFANVALFKFFSGDRLEAIDETEAAVSVFKHIKVPEENTREYEKYWRRGNSIYISLAYYYAEIIGTHDGRLAEAKINAEKYLGQSLDARARLSTCPNNALVSDDDLRECVNFDQTMEKISEDFLISRGKLSEGELQKLTNREVEANFQCIDCELFVRTQLADKISVIEEIRTKLNVLHEAPPVRIAALAEQLFQFHDYCLRQRLAELE
ncbi:nucleotidyltransferase family protein [Parasedimentitalea psychrophila]|uniref:RelA/SpoT domain-containing protein n=1 Tax=Parasedimentitalea psychrophila TaxID=2997337 RepID=A0A9Y2KXQ3_9RHOB|nr:hypothetical protein [Parasedimentitalea psychrophila]WIY23787.1 hypothetical protein QPJ95_14165 [Parasedimentitalea psychrophila]